MSKNKKNDGKFSVDVTEQEYQEISSALEYTIKMLKADRNIYKQATPTDLRTSCLNVLDQQIQKLESIYENLFFPLPF